MADYCFEDLGDHDLIQCSDWQNGGVSACGFLETDHSIADFTDEAEWNTAIAASEAVIVKQIKGEYPEVSEASVDSEVGCGPESILSGFDHSFNFTDPNVLADNDTFYEGVNGRELNLAIYLCEETKILVVERDCRPTIKPAIVPMSNKEFRKYIGRVDWSSPPDIFPTVYDAPANIFV